MLGFPQLVRQYRQYPLSSLVLLALFALLTGAGQGHQSQFEAHHFDASFSALEYEIAAESEENSFDDPLTPAGPQSIVSTVLLVGKLQSQVEFAGHSSQSYVQPPSRAPPVV